jgi:hypothetical protein
MVGTDERRVEVGKLDRGSDLKGPDRNLRMRFFSAAADNLKSARVDRAAPLAAAMLLAPFFEHIGLVEREIEYI